MTDVNKNIIDAYKSMYEPKEEVLDEKVTRTISQMTEKEWIKFNLMQSKKIQRP